MDVPVEALGTDGVVEVEGVVLVDGVLVGALGAAAGAPRAEKFTQHTLISISFHKFPPKINIIFRPIKKSKIYYWWSKSRYSLLHRLTGGVWTLHAGGSSSAFVALMATPSDDAPPLRSAQRH